MFFYTFGLITIVWTIFSNMRLPEKLKWSEITDLLQNRKRSVQRMQSLLR